MAISTGPRSALSRPRKRVSERSRRSASLERWSCAVSMKPLLAGSCVAALVVALHPPLALAAEDAVAGQKTFAVRCASCHGTTAGDKKLGPTLAGVFRHESGGV